MSTIKVEAPTPAWHTDRAAYAQRNDTHWTRSDHLPAHVIARTGEKRSPSEAGRWSVALLPHSAAVNGAHIPVDGGRPQAGLGLTPGPGSA
ncbi:hypothetical protein ABTY20_35015 [Streptomyces sp. NPDC126497]|uniref:hypothetical protein n=1 Tax=Streptomyces sp. NPDC126497 TaxID=3155313 RepID=UPI00331BC07E